MPIYFASYVEDWASEDQAALERAGCKFYRDGYAVSDAYFVKEGGGPTEMTARQFVRLEASDDQDAERQVTDALGRRPAGLMAAPGRGV